MTSYSNLNRRIKFLKLKKRKERRLKSNETKKSQHTIRIFDKSNSYGDEDQGTFHPIYKIVIKNNIEYIDITKESQQLVTDYDDIGYNSLTEDEANLIVLPLEMEHESPKDK